MADIRDDDSDEYTIVGRTIKVHRASLRLCKAVVRHKLKTNKPLRDSFEKLASWGCKSENLITLLALIVGSRNKDEWEPLFGFKPRQTKSIIALFRRSADECDKLGSSFVGRTLATYSGRANDEILAASLRQAATRWEVALKALSRNRSVNLDASKTKLLEYVIWSTGQPRYQQVSELISAAQGKDIDTVALRMWYTKYKKQHPASNPQQPKGKLT